MSKRRTMAVLLAAVLFGGCDSRPSAPPLHDDPIYRNARAGFRFGRPEGWKMVASSDVPAGPLPSERLLVEYKCVTGKSGNLEVTAASLPASTSLAEYIKKNTLTGESWRMVGPTEDFTINAVPAVRLKFALGKGKDEMTREIVAFRRDDRVYFFKGFYLNSDTSARNAIRAAVDSVVW
jgi:hypothetical protein